MYITDNNNADTLPVKDDVKRDTIISLYITVLLLD
jgi:hypothetical protein